MACTSPASTSTNSSCSARRFERTSRTVNTASSSRPTDKSSASALACRSIVCSSDGTSEPTGTPPIRCNPPQTQNKASSPNGQPARRIASGQCATPASQPADHSRASAATAATNRLQNSGRLLPSGRGTRNSSSRYPRNSQRVKVMSRGVTPLPTSYPPLPDLPYRLGQ